MNAIPPTPIAAGTPAGPLRARRCVRHGAREAVARCPSCGGFFCRECVVDHAGKLMCADCLARAAAVVMTKGPGRMAGVWTTATFGVGVLVVWMVFYAMGSLLLRMPPDFHEGTVWKDAFGGVDE